MRYGRLASIEIERILSIFGIFEDHIFNEKN